MNNDQDPKAEPQGEVQNSSFFVKQITADRLSASIYRKSKSEYSVIFDYLQPASASTRLTVSSDDLQELSRLAAVSDGWVALDQKRHQITHQGRS